MGPSSRAPQEIEATLIIWSDNPQAVVREIASLTSLAGYRLLSRDAISIRDLYFDTYDAALQAQRWILRLRQIGAAHMITLKGASQPTDWGGMERLEIEAPWSPDALNRIVNELLERRIETLDQRQYSDRAPPLEAMTSLGLEIIQDRETLRRVRDMVAAGQESRGALAELAIDSVIYQFGDRQVHHHEVEIEAKAENVSAALKTAMEMLVATYRPALREWDHSKLATGKAIEKMLREGALEELLDINNNLKPVAYERIDDYLERSGI